MILKNINCGFLIQQRVNELGIDIKRISNFLKCPANEIYQMYDSPSMDSELLLRWSKLLQYDFFRLYSQHIILYSPNEKFNYKVKSKLPIFRKNIYTQEIIDFILEQIRNGEITKKEVISRYKIPKTTLYKWLSKYSD